MGVRVNLASACVAVFTLLLSAYGQGKGGLAGNAPVDSAVYHEIDAPLERLSSLGFLLGDYVPVPEDSTTLRPDLVYEYRIAQLNQRSVIPLSFHPLVRKYIRIYTVERRGQVAIMCGLSKLYFPIFEELLDRYGLPLELVYLAAVESALNPLAVSKSGAVGLWQFKLNTGKMLNLHVDNFVDDRMDPVRSTEAACSYLEYLHRLFDDWLLALAAYNAGPGAVQRALLRAGGKKDFWDLLPYLPEAAQNYVPAFIAAVYVFHFAPEHGIKPQSPRIDYKILDTVCLRDAVSFEAVSRWVGTPMEILHFLNPRYRQGYVPFSQDTLQCLLLPRKDIPLFIENESRIYAQSYRVVQSSYPYALSKGKRRVEHVVKRGEYLHKIALQYGCTVDELRRWNGDRATLQPGERLEIWVDVP